MRLQEFEGAKFMNVAYNLGYLVSETEAFFEREYTAINKLGELAVYLRAGKYDEALRLYQETSSLTVMFKSRTKNVFRDLPAVREAINLLEEASSYLYEAVQQNSRIDFDELFGNRVKDVLEMSESETVRETLKSFFEGIKGVYTVHNVLTDLESEELDEEEKLNLIFSLVASLKGTILLPTYKVEKAISRIESLREFYRELKQAHDEAEDPKEKENFRRRMSGVIKAVEKTKEEIREALRKDVAYMRKLLSLSREGGALVTPKVLDYVRLSSEKLSEMLSLFEQSRLQIESIREGLEVLSKIQKKAEAKLSDTEEIAFYTSLYHMIRLVKDKEDKELLKEMRKLVREGEHEKLKALLEKEDTKRILREIIANSLSRLLKYEERIKETLSLKSSEAIEVANMLKKALALITGEPEAEEWAKIQTIMREKGTKTIAGTLIAYEKERFKDEFEKKLSELRELKELLSGLVPELRKIHQAVRKRLNEEIKEYVTALANDRAYILSVVEEAKRGNIDFDEAIAKVREYLTRGEGLSSLTLVRKTEVVKDGKVHRLPDGGYEYDFVKSVVGKMVGNAGSDFEKLKKDIDKIYASAINAVYHLHPFGSFIDRYEKLEKAIRLELSSLTNNNPLKKTADAWSTFLKRISPEKFRNLVASEFESRIQDEYDRYAFMLGLVERAYGGVARAPKRGYMKVNSREEGALYKVGEGVIIERGGSQIKVYFGDDAEEGVSVPGVAYIGDKGFELLKEEFKDPYLAYVAASLPDSSLRRLWSELHPKESFPGRKEAVVAVVEELLKEKPNPFVFREVVSFYIGTGDAGIYKYSDFVENIEEKRAQEFGVSAKEIRKVQSGAVMEEITLYGDSTVEVLTNTRPVTFADRILYDAVRGANTIHGAVKEALEIIKDVASRTRIEVKYEQGGESHEIELR